MVDHAVASECDQPFRSDRCAKPGQDLQADASTRKHALNYLGQLWMLSSDRRHEKDANVLMTELKAD